MGTSPSYVTIITFAAVFGKGAGQVTRLKEDEQVEARAFASLHRLKRQLLLQPQVRDEGTTPYRRVRHTLDSWCSMRMEKAGGLRSDI